MNKACYAFLFCLLLVASCKKEDGTVTCNIPSFNVSVANYEVTVNLTSYGSGETYDLEYGPAGFSKGSGTVVSFSGTSTTFTVSAYGSYDVYVRAKCGSTTTEWSGKTTVNVDGGFSSCFTPSNLNVNTTSYSTYRLEWYGNGNFYDVEYGPTGFTLGNGTRVRTNDEYTQEQIMKEGITYDFYVRQNCGGSVFSSWAGPHSVYAAEDQNVTTPCTQPTNLYAYKTSSTEISYTSQGHGSISYEISISTSNSSLTSNILSVSSPNGGVYNSGGYSGTYYFWIRGKCLNNSFTNWSVSQVQ
jgi:hypothetical protein